MIPCSTLLERLAAGNYDERLRHIYCCDDNGLPGVRERVRAVAEGFLTTFSRAEDTPVGLFSGPGRTELGGNHTDHQHGRVLAASVNLDALACAAPNGTSVIRILSEGYPMLEVTLSDLIPDERERDSSAALVRGVAAKISSLGYTVSGFDAYVSSNVLGGSGLSSSAAYEVMIGVTINHLFCHDALTAVQIAQIGQYAENVYFGKPSGLMDQMASAVGSAVAIDFADIENPQVHKVEYDFTQSGCALCIIDTGADHADLTDEYAAIPTEMGAVASYFGKSVLRDVSEDEFRASLPALRERVGDRAVLRAVHFFAEDKRAAAEAAALDAGDFQQFLRLAERSGHSSYMYLQNIYCSLHPKEQAVAVALAVAEEALGGEGMSRVHGGGFAGTIQAFVPLHRLADFKARMETVLGEGRCMVLNIRPEGGIVLID